MGRKLAELAEQVVAGAAASAAGSPRSSAGDTPGHLPGRPGVWSSPRSASPRTDAFAVHQYGVASMMLGAALRLMKINYLDAQAILFEVNGDAEAAYDARRATPRSTTWPPSPR